MTKYDLIAHEWKEGDKLYTFTFASMSGYSFPVEIIEMEYKYDRYEYFKYCCKDLFLTKEAAEDEFAARRAEAKKFFDDRINGLIQEIVNIGNSMSFYKLK